MKRNSEHQEQRSPEDELQLLRASEAAAMLGICSSKLHSLRRHGRLGGVVLGPRLVRYRLGDIRKLQVGGFDALLQPQDRKPTRSRTPGRRA